MSAFSELRDRAEAAYAAWLRPQNPRLDVAVDTASLAHGAEELSEALEGEARRSGAAVEFGVAAGVGLQWLHPTVTLTLPDGTRTLYGPVAPGDAASLIEAARGGERAAASLAIGTLAGSRPGVAAVAGHPFFAAEAGRRLLARAGHSDPRSLDHYVATGGYAAFARMLERRQTPEQVRELVTAAGLTGRGGAYFPAGVKWNFLAGAQGVRRTLICNADEGDPGAWVNRVLLEGDPHALIEGMLIAAWATGAGHGYIYVRDEYPLAVERVRDAMAQAEQAGLLGERVLGGELSFTLELIRGAGAYVCGEETGLINSVQDERGMPRVKPPFPANPGGGVYGGASNVNNVESYCNVPLILRHGAQWYRERGTQDDVGTRIFSLSGDVERVGFMEVPFGTPLAAVLEACGGVSGGGALKAIQSGGPLGGYLPGSLIGELVLERGSFQPHGAPVGSGGIVFVGEASCSVELNELFADFLEDESCGRCTTCHGGNQRMNEIFRRTAAGGGRAEDRRSLELLGEALQYSNCVHGSASPTVMRNTLRHFDAEYRAHVEGDGCGALRCAGFTRFRVVDGADPALAAAAELCPAGAIAGEGGSYRVDDAACVRCGACAELAPRGIAREAAPRGTAFAPPPAGGPPGSLRR